jgi:hypothetical protein
MEQGGCLYREPSPCVQEEEEVWDTDSDSDASEAVEADGLQRILAMDFGEDDDDSSEFSPEDEQEEAPEIKKDEKEPEPEREPLFEAPIPLGECPICYEELKMIDFTVTKCGHTFHSSCVFQALSNNLDCPMCRCQLLEVQEEEDSEGEDEDQEGEDYEESVDEGAEEEEEEDKRPTIEQLATKLQNMGYTPADLLTLFIGDLLKREDETRQTDEFLDTLNEKIDSIIDGRITMAHVDQRSYAQVVAPQPQQPQPQQVVRLKDLERIIRPQQEQQAV